VHNELIRKNVEGNGHDLIFWHLIGVTDENRAHYQEGLSEGQDLNTGPSKYKIGLQCVVEQSLPLFLYTVVSNGCL
jgi:hypothetical protein